MLYQSSRFDGASSEARESTVARFVIAATALGAAILWSGCEPYPAKATRVQGPDGRMGWYVLECGGSAVPCYERAAELCPDGYAIGDSQGGSITSFAIAPGGGLMAASSYKGNVLIKCKYAVEDRSAKAERERNEERHEAARAFAFCKDAYESARDMAGTWSDWFGGQAVSASPDTSQFMYLCGVVGDPARRCLDPDYARASRERCIAEFARLSNERRRALDRLFVSRSAPDASSDQE